MIDRETMRNLTTIFSVVAILLSCDSSTNPSSPVTATERWQLVQTGTTNTAVVHLYKHQNGALTSDGTWKYYIFGDTVICNFMSGSGSSDTSELSVSGSGTGYYKSSPSDNSRFSMTIKGKCDSTKWNGSWTMTFADTSWAGYADSGSFSGTCDSGSGVTH